MALLLLSIVVVGFVLFFYGIGLWYLAFLPLLFIAAFFGYYGATQTIKVHWFQLARKYSLYIAWVIILAWLVGVGNFFGMDMIVNALWLIGINLLLWIFSYLADYKDGKVIFPVGYYLSLLFLMILWFALWWRSTLYTIFMMIRVGNLAVVAFFIFVIGIYRDISKSFRYALGVLALGTIFLVVLDQIKNIYLALTINGLLLTGIYILIFKIFQHTPQTLETKKEMSVRRILAGERITAPKKYFNSKTMELLYTFLTAMPAWTKQILEIFNIVLIVILMVWYGTHVGDFAVVNHLLYRAVIATFVTNVICLKKIWYNSVIQNLVVFLVINFAIYVSLFTVFQGNIGSVVSRWIFRNIYSAAMIFYAHKIPMLAKIFTKTDYVYWIISSMAALIVNIILLIQTSLPGELIFFLVLVYVGIETMIIFYATKYLGKQTYRREE